MTEAHWHEIIDRVKDKFNIDEQDKSEETRGDGSWTRHEWVIFTGPMGRIKLERIIRPAITGEQRIYSRRQGTSAELVRTYSESETTQSLHAYHEVGGNWEELDPKAFL